MKELKESILSSTGSGSNVLWDEIMEKFTKKYKDISEHDILGNRLNIGDYVIFLDVNSRTYKTIKSFGQIEKVAGDGELTIKAIDQKGITTHYFRKGGQCIKVTDPIALKGMLK